MEHIASMDWERRARHIVDAIRTTDGVRRVAAELDEMDSRDGELLEGSMSEFDVLGVLRQEGDEASAAGFDELFALRRRGESCV